MGRFALAIWQNIVFTLIWRHWAVVARLFAKGTTMSSQHIQAPLPGMGLSPDRAGSLRAVVLDRLARAGHVVWRALEAQGARRADRELLALADRCSGSNPKLSRELRSYVRGGSSY
jgi:hypothetical protein